MSGVPQTINKLDHKDSLPLDARAKRGSAARPETEVVVGKGLDVGTANLLSAAQKRNGDVVVKRERNMFLEIPSDFQHNRTMLTKLNVPYVSYRDRLYVLGDASFNLANMFSREVRRPMLEGFLSPGEKDAIPMLRFIIERLLGPHSVDGESVFYSVPDTSIDRDNDTVYHAGVIEGLLRKLGYEPHPINEGHAVVYAELAEQDFTGIGISCGGGMFNVCVSYRSIPAVTFSVSRGGDWIDEHVARVMGLPRTRATDIKETDGVDLMQPRNREEEAVVLYYRNLIEYVLKNLARRFTVARDVPTFTAPVEMVVAGGTSMVGGFERVFAEELQKVDFPLSVSRVRLASEPLTSVVRGCLIAAALA